METINQLAAILFGAFLIWMLYRYVKRDPESLSGANINKSFYTMGILAVVLIAFIGLVVMLLRSS